MSEIVFEPFFPPWPLVTLAATAILVGGVSIWRGSRAGALLRLIALIGLLCFLANPQFRIAEETPLEDIAIIVIDKSASQSLDGRDAVAQSAAAALERRLSELGRVEIRRSEVAGADETRLIEGLAAALADVPRGRLAGIFLVTDGQASDAASADRIAPEVPVHVFNTGRAGEIDRKITLTKAPRYGIVREPAEIAFRVDDLGPDGAPVAGQDLAVVALRIDGKEILRESVPLGAEASFRAPLERPGSLVIELEVGPLPGELTERNNVAVLEISAIRDRLRVLLISGEPHPGERVWRNLLKSDPAVDLVHFTILRPLEKGNPTEIASELALIPFPQDELFIDKLSEFDLLIFDRYSYRGVLNSFHFDNIARYVEGGGAVLVATGPEFYGPLSLAERRNLQFILPAVPNGPAREETYRAELTDDGARHPATADLSDQDIWGRWMRIAPAALRSGRTLMHGPDGLPLLILDRVGEGRVGLLLSDHVWLWARGFDGGGPHAELLRRIAHWLMKEPELEEERLLLRAVGPDLLVERRSMLEIPGPVQLTAPDGAASSLALAPQGPGAFAARVENAPRGLYRARDGDLFAVGAIGLAAASEFQNVVSDMRPLGPLVERTGGGAFRIRRGDEVALPAMRRVGERAAARSGAGWAGIIGKNAVRIDSVRQRPAAPAWAWLLLLAAGILGAWLAEGGRGRRAPEVAGKI